MSGLEYFAWIVDAVILLIVLGCGVVWIGSHIRLFVRRLPRAMRRHWEARAGRHLIHMVRTGRLGL